MPCRIIPSKGTHPNKRTGPHTRSVKPDIVQFHKNGHNFLKNYQSFNPKPPLESWECQLSSWSHLIPPGVFIRDNTVHTKNKQGWWSNCNWHRRLERIFFFICYAPLSLNGTALMSNKKKLFRPFVNQTRCNIFDIKLFILGDDQIDGANRKKKFVQRHAEKKN